MVYLVVPSESNLVRSSFTGKLTLKSGRGTYAYSGNPQRRVDLGTETKSAYPTAKSKRSKH